MVQYQFKHQRKKSTERSTWNVLIFILIVFVVITTYFDGVFNSVSLLLPDDVGESFEHQKENHPPVKEQCVHILRVNDHLCEDDSPLVVTEWVLENSPHGHGNVSERVDGTRRRGMLVHTVLHERGIIQDPSYGMNEVIDSWVRDDIWTFRAEFDWPYTRQESTVLQLNRVDTVADVYVDGMLVGRTSSMHRRYTFDVSLDKGAHTISITLFPVGKYTEELKDKLPYPIPHTKHHVRVGHYNLVRKIAADFGWDFAPAFAPSGLLGSIVVSTRAIQVMEQVVIEQEHGPDGVLLHSSIFVRGECVSGEIRIEIRDPSGNFEGSSATRMPECQRHCTDDGLNLQGEDAVHAECFWKCLGPTFKVKDPELWWTWDQSPDGRKEQPLYSVTAVLACGPGCFIDKTVMIGLRSFELVREPIGQEESFYFRINGRMMYSKGSNLVPLNIFQDKIDVGHILDVIWSAKRAHFNTIRVWGGGGYLPDIFYEECDKHGIVVWQEFMFACAAYPTHVQFQVDVASEIHQQSLRIINHPSIALFGFNNENENSFDWFEETVINSALYAIDYYALFISNVRQSLRRVAPHAVYVDTSPSNGIYREDPVYEKRWGDVMDETRGDVHFYEYGANLLSDDVFPKAKFISEFGILSLPSWSVYSKYIDTTGNPRTMLEFRTRRKNGLQEMFQQMTHHFFPMMQASTLLDSIRKDTIRHLIYLSQLQQGLIYRHAAFHWRKKMNPEQTMGFLYWQHQDVGNWSGPSWSGLNSDASWKLLHYFARDFFAPLATFMEYKNNTINIYASNHHHGSIEATIRVDTIPYSASQESQVTQQCTESIRHAGYHRVCSFTVDNQTEVFIVVSVSLTHQDGYSTVFMPSEASAADLRPSNVAIESIDLSIDGHGDDECPPKYDGMFSMQVSSASAPALFVSFESNRDVHFIDNAVYILPWAPTTIKGCYHRVDSVGADDLRNSIEMFALQSSIAAVKSSS